MSESIAAKPPTQYASVQGIDAKPITMNQQQAAIDWQRLASLPPFQMFAAERMRNATGADGVEHALRFVRDQGAGSDLFDAYAQWHSEKGYWPNETPMSEVKE